MFALLLHVLRVARRVMAAFLATHGAVRQSLTRILHRDFPALAEIASLAIVIALDRMLPDRTVVDQVGAALTNSSAAGMRLAALARPRRSRSSQTHSRTSIW
jgi:hypothetical protein